MLEVDIARPVVEHFRRLDYRVHSEVQTGHGRADIVAVKGVDVIVVEAKTRFSFDVVAQAVRWVRLATRVYIVTPPARVGKMGQDQFDLLREVMSWKSIGWFVVDRNDGRVFERKAAGRQEKANTNTLLRALAPEQESGPEAGSRGGGYYTEYRGTCNRIAEYVKAKPGATLSDVVRDVPHHYKTAASARTALTKCAEKGVIHGIRAERNKDGAIALFLDDHPMRGSVRMSAAIESGLEEMGLAPSSSA